MSGRWAAVGGAALIACGAAAQGGGAAGGAPPPDASGAPADGASDASTLDAPCSGDGCGSPEGAAVAPATLHVKFLGVAGFLLQYGGESVLTAPLFTRASALQASTGLPVEADPALVPKYLPPAYLADVRAIVTGHAHYDHLLDVPNVLRAAPQATLFANVSARNLLAAYAPDRGHACADAAAPPFTIARDRVVALDDPAASAVDYTNCPDKRPAGAPLEGRWVQVPGAHVRVYAVCSEHPDQIGPVHFAPGDVTEEQCTAPTRMDAWKEGVTIAYLVDFLDPASDLPSFRVYYQDAPTNAPIGHVPPAVLAGKRVDLALLCVGSYDHVADAPTATIGALRPRFALGGHWEDFFQSADQPPQPIPFLDVAAWQTKAEAATADAEPRRILRNGAYIGERALLPQPGDTFEIAP